MAGDDGGCVRTTSGAFDTTGCAFRGSRALGKGGSASISDSSSCSSSTSTSLAEQPKVSFVACAFERNNASGPGGGAIRIGGGSSWLQSLSTQGNVTLNGGGGVLFWEGNIPPEEHGGISSGRDHLDGVDNDAAYGPLRATLFASLAVHPFTPNPKP